MILLRPAIKAAVEAGDIVIDPFDSKNLSVNSYDLHLSPHIAEYLIPSPSIFYDRSFIDPKIETPIKRYTIDSEYGTLLKPGKIYLASTVEYTETRNLVPMVTGKSSIGRLGIFVHVTAGQGDAGFCNHWTLELVCVEPIKIYAGMPIGQITYYRVDPGPTGNEEPDYQKESTYITTRNPLPQPSSLWKKLK